MKTHLHFTTACLFTLTLLLSLAPVSCVHAPKAKSPEIVVHPTAETLWIKSHFFYMPGYGSTPSYFIFEEKKRLKIDPEFVAQRPIVEALPIESTIRNPQLVAKIYSGKSLVRTITAHKQAPVSANQKNTSWASLPLRLVLEIPFLNPGEEVEITSSYEWMDTRWFWPVFLEDSYFTKSGEVVIDVPQGMGLRFRAAQYGRPIDLTPKTEPITSSIWQKTPENSTHGTRYIFTYAPDQKSYTSAFRVRPVGDLTQLLFVVSPSSRNEERDSLEGWDRVSHFLYNKIDRYEAPSDAIRGQAKLIAQKAQNPLAQIAMVFSFLKDQISKFETNPFFLFESAQPASMTYAKRAGSAFDRVILAQSFFTALGLESYMVAVGCRETKPTMTDFTSPALFDRVILATRINNKTLFFDPNEKASAYDQLPSCVQGQFGLVLASQKGYLLQIPFDSPNKHTVEANYELALNDLGELGGQFSVRLTGLLSDQIRAQIPTDGRPIPPDRVEQTAFLGDQESFLWRHISAIDTQNPQMTVITGDVAPIALNKNDQGQFLLQPEKIFGLLVRVLEDPDIDHPMLAKVKANMILPQGFKPAADLPQLINKNDQAQIQLTAALDPESNALKLQGETIIYYYNSFYTNNQAFEAALKYAHQPLILQGPKPQVEVSAPEPLLEKPAPEEKPAEPEAPPRPPQEIDHEVQPFESGSEANPEPQPVQ